MFEIVLSVITGTVTVITIIELTCKKRRKHINASDNTPFQDRWNFHNQTNAFNDGFDLGALYYEKLKSRLEETKPMSKINPPSVFRQTHTTNCPNCGAPLENGKCHYCGTNVSHTVSMSDITPYLNEGYKIHKVL